MSAATPKLPTPRRRPTISDVARLCGLSKATVSKALNLSEDECPLLPETRERVIAAAASIGYRPSWRGRVLARRKSHMIGMLYDGRPHRKYSGRGSWNHPQRGVYWNIVDYLEQLLEGAGYSSTFVRLKDQQEHCEQVLGDQRFDGCLALGDLPEPALQALRQHQVPVVMIDTHHGAEWTQISVDEIQGMTTILQHLYDLGHRRITYYPGRGGTPFSVSAIRTEAYLSFMREAGLEPDEMFVGPVGAFVDQLLNGSYQPTAVLDFEHWSAVRALQELWRRGVRVPDDLSYASFNDTYPVDAVIPPLTVMALPSETIADKAWELLQQRINSDEPVAPQKVILSQHLVVRESTAPPRSRLSISSTAGVQPVQKNISQKEANR